MTGEYSSHHRRWNEVKVHVVVDGGRLEFTQSGTAGGYFSEKEMTES